MKGSILLLILLALACSQGGEGATGEVRDAQDDAMSEIAADTTPDPGGADAPGPDASPDATPDATPDADDTATPFLASATQEPAGEIPLPSLGVTLLTTDDAARTVTVEVALEGALDASGVAFELAYDGAFFTPVDSALGAPFAGASGAAPKVLGAFVPARSLFTYGAALLRQAPVTTQETYYENGPFPMPSHTLTGRRVLATLTFRVPAAGSGQLLLHATDSVVKDRLFDPIPVTRFGVALVAN